MRKDISRSQRPHIFRTAPVRTEQGVIHAAPIPVQPPARAPATPENNVLVQRATRFNRIPHRQDTHNKVEIISGVSEWLRRPNSDFYLGFGGMGDALLTLAPAWNNPRATIIFFANGGSLSFIQKMFDLFGVPSMVEFNIMGQPWASEIHRMVCSNPHFRLSGHLADRMDYGDWTNESKYASRVVSKTAWVERWGKKPNPYDTQGIICIAPSGSHRDVARQRFLSVNEYKSLVQKYVNSNFTVYGVGSDSDYHVYGKYSHHHALWVSSDYIINGYGQRQQTNLMDMLQVLNSATEVYSMDTWLKTYTLLAGIPTTVIKTRWSGRYKNFGEDTTDWIFLNPKIWSQIRFAKIEELLI